MIPLKELISKDRADVFLALSDYGETHMIDGIETQCVLDSDSNTTLIPYEGIVSGGIRLFVRAEDIDYRRAAGDQLDIDGDLYEIVSWNDDMGLYTVTLVSRQG